MAGGAVDHADASEGPLTNPWPFLFTGLGASAAAFVLHKMPAFSPVMDSVLLGLRLVLLGAGLLSTAGAVVIRPGEPVVLGGAAVATVLAALGTDAAWDTVRLLLGLMAALAAVSALLLFLPRVARRAIVSLAILFHFAGILVAVGSVAPPNAQGSWLVSQLWTWVYRPYLQFMYLNNAYHFYSPEPGPATLLWFRVQYADGSSRRVKIVDRDLYPLNLEYQRRLSLTESTNQLEPPPAVMTLALQKLQDNRLSAGAAQGGIPPHPQILLTLQYRPPNLFSRRMLECYARHVARTTPHPTDPTQPVTGVKIYRVVHRILGADELSRGVHPLDPTTYLAYYQGDFEPDGKLKESCMKIGWTDNGYDVLEQDPYLYWLIPILREERPDEQAQAAQVSHSLTGEQRPARFQDLPVSNYVRIHAGDKDEGGDVW